MSWQPSAALAAIKARAQLNQLIRSFFLQRDVMEVETPLLCSSAASDPHLRSFALSVYGDQRYLQTSPEFCMKRLITAGAGPIYQLCKAFRHEQAGRHHNPEFTMLEWYRPHWSLEQLLDETEALVQQAIAASGVNLEPFPRWSYQQAFENSLGINPHQCSERELLDIANQHIQGDFTGLDRNGLLDLLMSHLVEPALPASGLFLTQFPASQAALAQTETNAQGIEVARRAELYIAGLEIANAYQELTDPAEQEKRFRADLQYRQQLGLDPVPIPDPLLAALREGLPPCAGVAMGIDRLMMIITTADKLESVLSFAWQQA